MAGHDKKHFALYLLYCLLGSGSVATSTVLLWSAMSHGQALLDGLQAAPRAYRYSCMSIVVWILVVLYLLDFFWPPHLPGRYGLLWEGDRVVGPGLVSVACLAFLAACMLMAESYSWAPMLLTIFFCPLVLACIRKATGPKDKAFEELDKTIENCAAEDAEVDFEARIQVLNRLARREVERLLFYHAAQWALLITGAVTLVCWVVWASQNDGHLEEVHKERGAEREEGFVLWATPLIVAVAFFTFAIIVSLRIVLGRAYARTDEVQNNLKATVSASIPQLPTEARERALKARITHLRRGHTAENFLQMDQAAQERYLRQHVSYMRQLQLFVKGLGTGILVLAAGIYVVYTLVTDNKSLFLMVQAFLVLTFGTFVGFIYTSFRRVWRTMGAWLVDMPLFKSAVALTRADWARAIALWWVTPALPFLLLLSVANQQIRRWRGVYDRVPCAWTLPQQGAGFAEAAAADESLHGEIQVVRPCHRLLTHRVHGFLVRCRQWNWLSIIGWTYVIGICVIGYVLTPITLNVFLSWMKSRIQDSSMASILVAVWLVGLVLFLLPPVPGAPIYLFGGVLVSGKGQSQWGDDGFWYGSFLCIGLCFVLKLSACFMQQKFIGELLGSRLWVRRAVGVHKPFIRAIEAVLRQPGLSFGKVMILCGGPDWPTSVLAGVLRLSVVQCEIGTTPIITYVAPLSLTGSFYFKRSENELWKNAGDLMFVITGIMTVTYWAIIGWVIQDTFVKQNKRLTRPMVEYLQLDWLDFKEDYVAKACAVSWPDVPARIQAPLVLGCLCLVSVGHLFYWTNSSSACFGSFEVTDDIRTLTWYGQEDSVIQPKGLMGLIFAGLSCLGWALFAWWRWMHTRGPRAAAETRVLALEAQWKAQRLLEAQQAEMKAAQSHSSSCSSLFSSEGEEDFSRRSVLSPAGESSEREPPAVGQTQSISQTDVERFPTEAASYPSQEVAVAVSVSVSEDETYSCYSSMSTGCTGHHSNSRGSAPAGVASWSSAACPVLVGRVSEGLHHGHERPERPERASSQKKRRRHRRKVNNAEDQTAQASQDSHERKAQRPSGSEPHAQPPAGGDLLG